MNILLLRHSIRTAAGVSYSRSGGPGGQNVNKVNTKVTLRMRLADMDGLSEPELARVRELLAGRITGGDEIIIAADEERSRRTNQERAFCRMEALISSAGRLPKKRRPTRPSKTAREQRLKTKKINSRKKADRRIHSGE